VAGTEVHPIAVVQGQADVDGAGGGGQGDGAAGGLVHQPAAGDVVGVGMGVDRGHQFDTQLADQGEIAAVLLEDRINQHPCPAGDIGEQIGEGACLAIEQLAKQKRAAPRGGSQAKVRRGGGLHGNRLLTAMSLRA